MAELLKNYLDRRFVENLSLQIKKNCGTFDSKKFNRTLLDSSWPHLELKQRIRRIALLLFDFLPGNFEEKIRILKKTIPHVKGLGALLFPDFVEVHGLEYWKTSMDALKFFTPFISSEFAIRPFIVQDPAAMMPLLLKWSSDKNEHVRRLSSEGCRPRLPWSFKLRVFIEDPSPILKILDNLKDDKSLYVRKSVANNLNDIAKDHPDLILKVARQWIGKSGNTDWILKHGLRTLLKRGDQRALEIFGLTSVKHVSVPKLDVSEKPFKIGGDFEFSFDLDYKSRETRTLRLEYAIHYLKKNGTTSKKVFKIKEILFSQGKHSIKKKHSLKQMTTRIHYPGQHRIDIIINGQTKASKTFNVK